MASKFWAGVGLAATLVAVDAKAEPRPYRGPHPVDHDGHWHHEDKVHVHDDLPVGTEPFAEIDGVFVFLADPEAYGFAGPVYTYRGAHPLPPTIGGYCGVLGVHRHSFQPEGVYRVRKGVYRFAGSMPGGTRAVRPSRLVPSRRARREASPDPSLAPPVPVFRYFSTGRTPLFRPGAHRYGVRGRKPVVRSRRRSDPPGRPRAVRSRRSEGAEVPDTGTATPRRRSPARGTSVMGGTLRGNPVRVP